MANVRTLTIDGVTYDIQDNVSGYVTTDENLKQTAATASSYTYWRPLVIGNSASATEGFTPSTGTAGSYVFNTLEAQPSTGTIRMGKASFFNGSYTHKLSPTTLTANHTATLPDKSGTIAFTDDIPPLVTDLGNIDPSEYEDDRDVFLNTLLQDGTYRFVWEDGDDYELYVVVESMIDSGYVYQKYWSSEEGSKYQYHCTLTVEDGEVIDRAEETYMTLSDAISAFSPKTHAHYDSIDDAMSVFDWCETSDLTFDNAKPFILYTDTLNNKNWVIERYATVRQPKYRFIRVYDTSDSSHFYIRSGSVSGNTTTWSQWKTYPSNGVTDVLVNNSSVVNNGIASISISDVGLSNDYYDLDNLPTIPSKTSDLNNDSGFITSFTETDPTVPAWAKASTKPSYNFSEIGSTPTTISGYGLTDAYTKTEVDNLLLALPEPMIFKGSLGTGGTITTLPAAAASNEGFVYKVITDGTYASQAAKVGDTFISDGSTWVLIPSGDEPSGTVTSVGLSNATNGGLTISGSPVTSSGTLTIGHSNVLTSAQTTSGIYPIKIDKNGHISEYGSAITIPTVTDTYSGTSSDAMSGKAVKSAIDALDGTVSGSAGSGKTLTAFSQTDGKVSATFGDISITKSQISDFPTIPSITLNGSSTTSPSFYAPTTAGTNGYYLKSNGSGAPTWDSIPAENMIVNVTNGQNEGEYIADKTYAEIVDAISAGKNVTCIYDGVYYLNDIYYAAGDSDFIKFNGLAYSGDDVYTITFWDDDTIDFDSYTVPSITLNGSSTASPSFYAPTSAGTSGYVLTSSGSGAPSWTSAVLTDTTYSLSNALSSHKFTSTLTAGGSGSGTSTATMEFVAGTGITLTDDTSNKKITIASSIVNTDEKVKAESASDNTVYYPVMGGNSGNAETKKYSSDLRFSKEDNDFAELQIGNDSEQGFLVLGDGDNHYAHIHPNYPLTGDRAIRIPDKDGILALTSDIPSLGDYITEYGESGNWQYQKYASGRIVMEGYYTFPSLSFSASGNVYRSTGNSFTIPNGVFTDTPTHGEAWIQGSDSVYISAIIGGLTTTGGKCQFVKTTSGNATNISAHIRIIQKGTIT